ncbi:hypothetical protein EC844_104119 [Acinetobacter calcoaceticus]|uniref:Uncharacterized protein n=1 Tax=Acinetobacter calcoaceticus TaxID=471 RepID=A0A4R1Y8H9_ACICA|nr:hypothetical protein EC844_104119 [Acinetobacter calcoaceticus]
MLVLIVVVIVLVLGFVLVQRIDQGRWHRYQFERDIFFRNHPYQYVGNEQFEQQLLISKPAQRKLINDFMWKNDQQVIYKKVLVLREIEQQQRTTVKVIIRELTLGYVEQDYAASLCQQLQSTDFEIGRPIEVLAEFTLATRKDQLYVSHIKLDLPFDPRQVKLHLLDATKEK